MPEPLPRLILGCLWDIYKFCIHSCHLDAGCTIVGDVELYCEGAKLLELELIDDHILVIGKDHVQVPAGAPLEVLDIPYDLPLLQVAVSVAILSVLDL
jgi:hypothetical protein